MIQKGGLDVDVPLSPPFDGKTARPPRLRTSDCAIDGAEKGNEKGEQNKEQHRSMGRNVMGGSSAG